MNIAPDSNPVTSYHSTVHSSTDQRKHQSFASLAFVWGIHRWPVNSPHKWPVTRKMFPFDDVIMCEVFHLRILDEFDCVLTKPESDFLELFTLVHNQWWLILIASKGISRIPFLLCCTLLWFDTRPFYPFPAGLHNWYTYDCSAS